MMTDHFSSAKLKETKEPKSASNIETLQLKVDASLVKRDFCPFQRVLFQMMLSKVVNVCKCLFGAYNKVKTFSSAVMLNVQLPKCLLDW